MRPHAIITTVDKNGCEASRSIADGNPITFSEGDPTDDLLHFRTTCADGEGPGIAAESITAARRVASIIRVDGQPIDVVEEP